MTIKQKVFSLLDDCCLREATIIDNYCKPLEERGRAWSRLTLLRQLRKEIDIIYKSDTLREEPEVRGDNVVLSNN